MFVLLLSLLALGSPAPVPPQIHEVGTLTSLGAVEGRVLFQAIAGTTEMQLYLLEMGSQRLQKIDPQLPKTVYRILPMDRGFAIFGHLVNRIFYLDLDGKRIDETELSAFTGALPEMIVAEIFPWQRGQALLCFETNDSDALFLARLDLTTRHLEILGNFPLDAEGAFAFAYPIGDHFLLCDKASGRISQIRADGHPAGPDLLPPQPRVPTPQFGSAAAQDKLSARLKYRSRITDPLPCADGFSFALVTSFGTARMPEQRQTKRLSAADPDPRTTDLLVLHRHGGHRLVWDLVSGSLIFLPD